MEFAAKIARSAYGHATQDPEEFTALLRKVLALRPRVVLEIGVYYGGTLQAWAQVAAPDALIIGVDLEPEKAHVQVGPGQTLVLIAGDTTAPETLAKVREALGGREVDFLFIDGCHEEAYCRSDVETFVPLVRGGGLVGMHDVVGNGGVQPVWAELKARYGGETFFSDNKPHRMGIGSFHLPETPETPKTPTLGMAILTYGHPDWLEGLLSSMQRYGWPGIPVRVFRDGPAFPYVAQRTDAEYQRVCERFNVPLLTLPKWGCIQANAEQAMEHTPEDWVLMIQDDNLVTPGFFDHLIGVWREAVAHPNADTLGMLQLPMWHATDLIAAGLIRDRQQLDEQPDLLETIPVNPGWGAVGEPRLYIGAHGSGFLARRKVWEMTGGFSSETWCFDEDLSCKTWAYTPYCVYQVNGPPMVHGMPGVVGTRPQPAHRYGHASGWEQAWGKTREECNRLQRQAMELSGGDGCPLSCAKPRSKGVLQ